MKDIYTPPYQLFTTKCIQDSIHLEKIHDFDRVSNNIAKQVAIKVCEMTEDTLHEKIYQHITTCKLKEIHLLIKDELTMRGETY